MGRISYSHVKTRTQKKVATRIPASVLKGKERAKQRVRERAGEVETPVKRGRGRPPKARNSPAKSPPTRTPPTRKSPRLERSSRGESAAAPYTAFMKMDGSKANHHGRYRCGCNWTNCSFFQEEIKKKLPEDHPWRNKAFFLISPSEKSDKVSALRKSIIECISANNSESDDNKKRFNVASHHWHPCLLLAHGSRSNTLTRGEVELFNKVIGHSRLLESRYSYVSLLGPCRGSAAEKKKWNNSYVQAPIVTADEVLQELRNPKSWAPPNSTWPPYRKTAPTVKKDPPQSAQIDSLKRKATPSQQITTTAKRPVAQDWRPQTAGGMSISVPGPHSMVFVSSESDQNRPSSPGFFKPKKDEFLTYLKTKFSVRHDGNVASFCRDVNVLEAAKAFRYIDSFKHVGPIDLQNKTTLYPCRINVSDNCIGFSICTEKQTAGKVGLPPCENCEREWHRQHKEPQSKQNQNNNKTLPANGMASPPAPPQSIVMRPPVMPMPPYGFPPGFPHPPPPWAMMGPPGGRGAGGFPFGPPPHMMQSQPMQQQQQQPTPGSQQQPGPHTGPLLMQAQQQHPPSQTISHPRPTQHQIKGQASHPPPKPPDNTGAAKKDPKPVYEEDTV